MISTIMKRVDYIMAQTDADADRFMRLGAKPLSVAVYGNAKFDQVPTNNGKAPAEELARYFSGIKDFIFVAGSIRGGEIGSVIKAVKKALERAPDLHIVLALRHMKELPKLEMALQTRGLSYVKRSEIGGKTVRSHSVMVLDTMGELGSLYHYADLAFVGGSLVKIGGHDPLEPAAAGCAVCFGRHMENSRMFADILVQANGALYVNSGNDLNRLIVGLASDKSRAEIMGEKARQAVLSHSGVSAKAAQKLVELL
jgi:3-deoxy-D-manno-octulosonic-acid transferase